MMYFDTSYIVRLYLEDPGWHEVRELAATDHVACCLLGHAEVLATFHRKFREGGLNHRDMRAVVEEFERESEAGAFQWLPFSEAVVDRVRRAYASLGKNASLRAADAVHLACAADSGFTEIYSNDRHLLSAADRFGLRGRDVF